MHRYEPLVERNFRPLHNRSDRHGELLATGIALIDARTMGLTVKARDCKGVAVAAMGAKRNVRPALRLQIFTRLLRIMEAGIGDFQRSLRIWRIIRINRWLCQPYSCRFWGAR